MGSPDTQLIVLLRGINVGRNKRIAMADLRALLTGLGYRDVATVLQSGNAIVSCDSAAAPAVAGAVAAAVDSELGISCAVMTRTAAELRTAIADDPFRGIANDYSRYLLSFFDGTPTPGAVAEVHDLDVLPDRIHIIGNHAYQWSPDGVLASPLNTTGWLATLGVSATARNWNTVLRLDAALGA